MLARGVDYAETLTDIERPRSSGYTLDGIEGPLVVRIAAAVRERAKSPRRQDTPG